MSSATSFSTIQNSFPPIASIISDYNKPLYTSTFKTQFTNQDYKKETFWSSVICRDYKSAINHIVSQLENEYQPSYESLLGATGDIEDEEEMIKQKDEYFYEIQHPNCEGEVLFKLRSKYKTEENLRDVFNLLRYMEAGYSNKICYFHIEESHIETFPDEEEPVLPESIEKKISE